MTPVLQLSVLRFSRLYILQQQDSLTSEAYLNHLRAFVQSRGPWISKIEFTLYHVDHGTRTISEITSDVSWDLVRQAIWGFNPVSHVHSSYVSPPPRETDPANIDQSKSLVNPKVRVGPPLG